MYFRRFRIWFFAIAAFVVLLSATVLVQKRLDTIVKEDKLVDEGNIEGLPPMVAFTTVALGGFRGILADMLWLRTNGLQQQGKYFEMVQLASWITKLQPKFTGATAYLAWNMAYNISVTFTSPVDRWRWVQRGIELIRDEALNYNPNDPLLYRELGWIYQHKIGNMLDDAQRYYKYMICKEMMKAYGGVEPDWEALAAAPKSNAEFRKLHAEDAALWEALKKAGFEDLDALQRKFRELGALPDGLAAALKPGTSRALECFLRNCWLREYYKLRPEIVLEINRKYGTLDWRLSDSFAIYWATLGIMYSPKRQSIDCDRMITQSLKESFIAGRILLPGKEPSMNYMLIPNLDLVDAVRETYQEAYERNDTSTFKSALDNFMKDAVVTLYSYGKYAKAREYFRMIRKERRNDPRYQDFDQFILREWTEDVKDGNYKQVHELISGLIFQSCLLLGYDDPDGAQAHLRLAEIAYNRFQKEYDDEKGRVRLPPFDTMKTEIARSVIQNFPAIGERVKAYISNAQAEKAEETASGASAGAASSGAAGAAAQGK